MMENDSEDNEACQQTVDLAVSVSPFNLKDSSSWFRQLESQFAMKHITSSESKFHTNVLGSIS